MLADRYQQLLTAYVDGQLSSRQRKAALRLLRRSAEARDLLRGLQRDAERLRRLPRHKLDPDFPARVLRALPKLYPAPAARRPAPRTLPAWAGPAAAAAVLFLVGAGAYVYFVHNAAKPSAGESPVAQNDDPARPVEDDGIDPAVPKDGPSDGQDRPKGPGKIEVADSTPDPAQTPPDPPLKESEADKTVLGKEPRPLPDKEMFDKKPKTADVSLSFFKVKELEADKLLEALKKDKDAAYRLELPCKEGNQAFDRLRRVLEAQKVKLVVEQVAQYRLKKPSLHTNYVLYMEDVTPDELVKVVQQLGRDDRSTEKAPKGDASQFGPLIVSPMIDKDREELRHLLGAYAKLLQSAKPSAKGPERQALVLPYNPVAPQEKSAEVKRYLESRRTPRPGTLHVLLVLREANG